MTFRRLKIPTFLVALACFSGFSQANEVKKPNIILMMADDLGYGDVGFNGNKVIKTPSLDAFAKAGVNMTHSYAGGPVCSPTRGTCLTGRHYQRYGIHTANVGHLPREEITISEMLKDQGYMTGHFGKWHLGTLSKTSSAKGPKRKPLENYSPPQEHGYDETFVVESAVGTWDPGYGKRAVNNPFYHNGKTTMENLKGGAARVVMDRVIPFIEKANAAGKPFFAVIWFNAPHEDILAGEKYLEMYKDYDQSAAYYGCVTELDEQVGRLQAELKKHSIYKNTLQFFTSDNGPEGSLHNGNTKRAGSSGGFDGRKRDLYDGGVRVPTAAVWPGIIPENSVSDVPASTLDYFPTIANIVSVPLPKIPYDGTDILPQISGKTQVRNKAIPFIFGGLASLVKGKYKYMTKSSSSEEHDILYDLSKDKREKNNLLSSLPEVGQEMRKEILNTLKSFEDSHNGKDYNSSTYKPASAFKTISANNGQPISPKNNQKGGSKSKKAKTSKKETSK